MQPPHQGWLGLTLVASRALSLAARIAGKAGFAGFLRLVKKQNFSCRTDTDLGRF
jgi:hypothetical protein